MSNTLINKLINILKSWTHFECIWPKLAENHAKRGWIIFTQTFNYQTKWITYLCNNGKLNNMFRYEIMLWSLIMNIRQFDILWWKYKQFNKILFSYSTISSLRHFEIRISWRHDKIWWCFKSCFTSWTLRKVQK